MSTIQHDPKGSNSKPFDPEAMVKRGRSRQTSEESVDECRHIPHDDVIGPDHGQFS